MRQISPHPRTSSEEDSYEQLNRSGIAASTGRYGVHTEGPDVLLAAPVVSGAGETADCPPGRCRRCCVDMAAVVGNTSLAPHAIGGDGDHRTVKLPF